MDGIVTQQQLVDKPRPAPDAAMAGKSDPCGGRATLRVKTLIHLFSHYVSFGQLRT
jgi:hypothetical protein